jgi:hypothetical protein
MRRERERELHLITRFTGLADARSGTGGREVVLELNLRLRTRFTVLAGAMTGTVEMSLTSSRG